MQENTKFILMAASIYSLILLYVGMSFWPDFFEESASFSTKLIVFCLAFLGCLIWIKGSQYLILSFRLYYWVVYLIMACVISFTLIFIVVSFKFLLGEFSYPEILTIAKFIISMVFMAIGFLWIMLNIT